MTRDPQTQGHCQTRLQCQINPGLVKRKTQHRHADPGCPHAQQNLSQATADALDDPSFSALRKPLPDCQHLACQTHCPKYQYAVLHEALHLPKAFPAPDVGNALHFYPADYHRGTCPGHDLLRAVWSHRVDPSQNGQSRSVWLTAAYLVKRPRLSLIYQPQIPRVGTSRYLQKAFDDQETEAVALEPAAHRERMAPRPQVSNLLQGHRVLRD